MLLFDRFCVPVDRLCIVIFHALAPKIEIRQIDLCVRISAYETGCVGVEQDLIEATKLYMQLSDSGGKLGEMAGRKIREYYKDGILFDGLLERIEKVILCHLITFHRRLAVQDGCLLQILSYSPSGLITAIFW